MRGATTAILIALLTCAIAISNAQALTEAEKKRTTDLWPSLMDAIQPYRNSLESWSVEFDEKKWYSQNRVMPSTAAEFTTLMNDLVEIEKIITSEKFSGLKGFWGREDDIIQRPQNWQEICQARVQISQKVLKRELPRILKPQILTIQLMTQSLRDFDGWGLSEEGLSVVMGKRDPIRKKTFEKVSSLFTAVQLPMEGTTVDEVEKACDELVAVAKELAPKAKPSATASITSIVAPLKQRWASGLWKDRKITKVNTESATWKITKNAVGTPLYRTCSVVVQFKLDGFDYLIEYSTQIKEDYKGSGKYQYVTSNIAPEYRIIKS